MSGIATGKGTSLDTERFRAMPVDTQRTLHLNVIVFRDGVSKSHIISINRQVHPFWAEQVGSVVLDALHELVHAC